MQFDFLLAKLPQIDIYLIGVKFKPTVEFVGLWPPKVMFTPPGEPPARHESPQHPGHPLLEWTAPLKKDVSKDHTDQFLSKGLL